MKLALIMALLGLVLSDTYLTNMRGSNNRLNENTATRANGNRLFDSQNNARGGHNTGDLLENAAGNEPRRQYSMQYYASGAEANAASKLIVEWTNQHGCGGNTATSPHKVNCNMVIQYMCMNNGTDSDYPTGQGNGETDVWERNVYMRDGTNTGTQAYTQPNKNEIEGSQTTKNNNYNNRMTQNYKNVQTARGLQETVHWYDKCRFREANGGLFHADQNLGTGSLGYIGSERTRQNNGGTRRGYECPEERDHYPYWAPTLMSDYNAKYQNTPWIDLAMLTSNNTDCDLVDKASFNQNSKWECVLGADSSRKYGRAISKEACEEEGGSWVEFHSFLEILTSANTEAKCKAAAAKDKRNAMHKNKITWMSMRSDETDKYCVVQAPPPRCADAPWTRVNHLGNSPDSQGNASRWEANIPHFPSGEAKRCVMRLRYNISTDEYDPYGTDSRYDQDEENGVVSPVEQNPFLDVAGNSKPLRLAMNTNQYGRTFQDRTHAWVVLPRTAAMAGKVLHNLNVRGKRGNIVQTFPGVEYDFVPSKLVAGEDDLLHIQWTGSNTHNNGGNGGDGQTGDAGEGKGGSDRHNFLEMQSSELNFPVPFSNSTFWDMVESVSYPKATAKDLAIAYATSGYYCGYQKYQGSTCPTGHFVKTNTRNQMSKTLDNAGASFFGHVLKFKKSGTCIYMCTRNNNFTNRSQKGVLWVKPGNKK